MTKERKARLRRARIAATLWGVFLFAITSWPSPPTVPLISAIPEADMYTHFLLYAVEAFFLYRAVAWPGRQRFSAGRVLTIVGTLAAEVVAEAVLRGVTQASSVQGWPAVRDL